MDARAGSAQTMPGTASAVNPVPSVTVKTAMCGLVSHSESPVLTTTVLLACIKSSSGKLVVG